MATNFETKKINELTEAAEVEDSDLTVTGDPGTGLLKKITFKNLILSIKDRLLGNTSEIANMGDGTVTGAIKQLDSDISDTQEITTDAFDETKSYAVGDYCIYDNTLYKFKEEKSAGEWDDEAVEKTNTMTELNSSVSTLNSALAALGSAFRVDSFTGSSTTIESGSYGSITISVTTPSGYTTLGAVGFNSGNSNLQVSRVNVSSNAGMTVRNTGSSSVTAEPIVYILFVKTSLL